MEKYDERKIAAERFDRIHAIKVSKEEATHRAVARFRRRPLRYTNSRSIESNNFKKERISNTA